MKLLTRAIPFIIAAFWILSSGALLAQDTTPPTLTSLTFTPTTINVASAPANVTVNFMATDSGSPASGVFYVEVGFLDPTGTVLQRGCASAGGVVPGCGSFTGGASVTSSLTVAFPQFSTQGAWTVGYALIFDANFNLTLLGPLGLGPLPSNPGTLQVNSVLDTTGPTMTAFTFTPTSIDTTSGPATVNMNFTLTDDISGAASWQIGFTSPSGASTQSATVTLTPGTTVSGTASITFPQFSEAGTWTITSVIMADAVGNTTVWSGSAVPPIAPPSQMAGFTTTLSVASSPDTTPPNLNPATGDPATTGFSFTPTSVNVTSSPATITVSFHATDPAPNPSGVNSFQVLLTSPSTATTLGATSNFAATASASGTPTFTFPVGSELGTWVVTSVTLTDAAGNVHTYSTADLIAAGFPTQLMLVTGGTDTTPPVIVPTVTPTPNGFGWNNTTPVSVSWSVTDPESTISSTTGCGSMSVSVQTAGITFTCTATNSAGLQSSVSVVVKIDTTPPTVAPLVSPAPNGAGWNNTDTTVSWALADALSGLSGDSLTGGGVPPGTGCITLTFTAETAGTTLTCTAMDEAGNAASASVTVKIDKTPPVTSNTIATPNPVQINNGTTITATITDPLSGGVASGVAAAQYNVDGGAFSTTGVTGTFGGGTANISITIAPYTATGIHIYCVQGIDVAGNPETTIGNNNCVIVAVFDPNGGFVTGGGAVNSPAGAYLPNTAVAGTLSFGFNFKYLPNTNPPAPSGSLEVQFQAANLNFKSTGFTTNDYLVITTGRGQVQGNGTVNGTIACKFQLDSWDNSFQPGNVDAFGLKIYQCSDGVDRLNLSTMPLARGSIQIHP